MPEPNSAEEIAHIEREIEILRDRLARFIYWGGVLRTVVPICGYVAAGLLCFGSLTWLNSRPVLSGVGLIAALTTAVLVWLSYRGWTLRDWVDMASPQRVWGWNGRHASEAAAIEEMISDRVARLAVLRGEA